MSSANLTRDETAARAAGIQLETVEVDLDVRGALTDLSFATSSTFTLRSSTTETWIDFIGESVDEVVIDGVARAVEWDGARVRITGLVPNTDHVAVVTIRGRGLYSTSGEGLHRFRDPADGETYLYTQYEPADCRRVYPCFEQPDLKARWRMSVSAPESWAVLSNGAEIARVGVEGGVRVSFAETSPLSSYITAVATGPYHRVDGVWDGPDGPVDLGVLCRASLARYLDADEILDVTRRGLTFFSESFGVTYPWGKYDQIFVPEINVGAMENPGLVTFTEHYVFRGAATAAQHEGRANTILHEMAHMWFGDLVTMRWWDDLWLKESFADYMGAHAAVAAGGFPDAWVTFASRRKGWAYVQDQLPTTHPIVADIPDLEAAKLNFDGITYAKGASVLKQLVAFVGEDAFFRGARHYFAAHAYGNTTLPDLLAALEEASGRDLTAWSAAWLQTSGVSDVAVERDGEGEAVLVRSAPRPDHIVIGFFSASGGRLVRRGGAELDGDEGRMPLPERIPGDVDLVLPNVDDRTYAKVRLDARSTDAVAAGLSTIDDAVARAVVWAALWNATRDGILPVARYLDIVTCHAPAEPNIALLGDALAHANDAISHYATVAARPALARRWLDAVWTSMHAAVPGSDGQLAWARAVGAAAARDDTLAGDLSATLAGVHPVPTGLALDPELRWSWLTALAATGHATEADADAELALDPSSHGEIAHRTVLAARPDAAVREAAWRAAWTDTTLSNDHLDAVIAGVRAGGRRDLVASFDADYFARIRPAWTERSIEIARRLVIGLFPASESLDLVDAWLETHADAPAALRRLVLEQRDGLARDLRVRAAQPSL